VHQRAAPGTIIAGDEHGSSPALLDHREVQLAQSVGVTGAYAFIKGAEADSVRLNRPFRA
jgi:hypothetical protein